MSKIREIGTLTSKGQITLPRSIGQVLGVGPGDKLVFEQRGSEVVVSRADTEHENADIGAFLDLLQADIEADRHLGLLPKDLAGAMLASAGHVGAAGEDIEGEVAI